MASRKKSQSNAASGKAEEIFSTPLFVATDPDPALISALEEAILERRADDPGVKRSNLGGWQSDDRLLEWGGEAASRLLGRVTALARAETTLKGGAPAPPNVKWFVRGRANVDESGASHSAHADPGSFWSAIYFVRTDPGPGGEVILHDPRSPGLEMYAPSLWFANAGVQREGTVKPVAGMLIMFPAWLVRSIRPWYGEGLRISIEVQLRPEFS